MPLTILTCTSDAEKHELDITSLIFYNNKLYSGADDGKIKAWDEDLKLVVQAQAHPCSIFSMCIGQSTLYTCSNDGSVKAWALDSLKRKYTILQEENEMYKVCFDSTNGKMYVGDHVGLVRIVINEEIVGVLEIMHPIVDMLAIGNLIYTARDLYVIITEIDSAHKRMVTIKAIPGRAPISVSGGLLWFTSRSGRDILVHENMRESSFRPVGKIEDAHDLIINAICGISEEDNKYLFTGGWDKVLKKWKLVNESTIQLIGSCPVEVVITALTSGPNGEIYVGGDDGRIFRMEDKL